MAPVVPAKGSGPFGLDGSLRAGHPRSIAVSSRGTPDARRPIIPRTHPFDLKPAIGRDEVEQGGSSPACCRSGSRRRMSSPTSRGEGGKTPPTIPNLLAAGRLPRGADARNCGCGDARDPEHRRRSIESRPRERAPSPSPCARRVIIQGTEDLMSLRRGLLFMLVLIGLSSPGCAGLGRPPEKKEQAQEQERRGDSSMLDEDAEHAQLEKDLSMYSD